MNFDLRSITYCSMPTLPIKTGSVGILNFERRNLLLKSFNRSFLLPPNVEVCLYPNFYQLIDQLVRKWRNLNRHSVLWIV